MFCPNCGAPNRDDVAFCASCGTKLNAGTTPAPAPASTPATPTYYAPPTPTPAPVYTPVYTPGYAPYPASTTLVPKIKALVSSPIMLIAAIAYTVSAALSVISNIMSAGYLGNVALTFISLIPTLICSGFVIAGLWHIYVQGKNTGDKFGTFGFGAIKGICIFNLVMTAIGDGVIAIILFAGMAAADGLNGDVAAFAIFVSLLIVVAVMVLRILFYSKASSSLGNAKNAVERKTPTDSSASGYVAVMCFLSAGVMMFGTIFSMAGVEILDEFLYQLGPEIYSMFSSMFSLSDSPVIVMSNISSISSVIAYAMFGVLVFKYNSIINEEYAMLYSR